MTLLVFSSIAGLVFLAFFRGTMFFKRSVVRQELQSELTRFDVLFERDAVLTDHGLCIVEDRILPDGVRDALAMVTVTDWKDPSHFDPVSQLPHWNEYVVYYATAGPEGRMFRQLVSPPSPPGGFNLPYLNLSANLNDLSPEANADVTSTTIVSEHVADFDVTLRAQGEIQVDLRLQRANNSGKVSGPRAETLESNFLVKPLNTWPEI